MDCRRRGEELLKDIVIGIILTKRQVKVDDLYIREMVVHIMTESYFTVLLLLACHVAILHLFHKHDLFLLCCNKHQHACGKITATERILSVKGEGLQVGHIRVE